MGRTDAEAEAPIVWPPDAKSQLSGKDPDAGKDWGQEEKGVIEGEMVGWHHRLNGQDFEQTLGQTGGQRSLACCSPRGLKGQTRLSSWTAAKPGIVMRVNGEVSREDSYDDCFVSSGPPVSVITYKHHGTKPKTNKTDDEAGISKLSLWRAR